MSYTASGSVARIKLKGFVSASGSLGDSDVLAELNDALRTDIVAFLKSVRDEWFVDGTESVTPDSDGRIVMPNSVASTIRAIWWNNNGQLTPLTRIEPEASFAYINNGAGQPAGYMLRGYGIQILPNNVGSVSIKLDFMDRPPEMVLEEDAALISGVGGAALTLDSVPLAWQSETPDAVDIISSDSPYSAVVESAGVVSLVGSTLTLGASFDDIESGFWVSDVGTSPFPNIPVELHPLLQQYVICTLGQSFGDARLGGWEKRLMQLEEKLRVLVAPRTQGSARPLLNPSAPGARIGRGRWGW